MLGGTLGTAAQAGSVALTMFDVAKVIAFAIRTHTV